MLESGRPGGDIGVSVGATASGGTCGPGPVIPNWAGAVPQGEQRVNEADLAIAKPSTRKTGNGRAAVAANPNEFERKILPLPTLAAVTGATTVLVLQAGLDPAEAADLARAYAELGATLMVATKLDLARRLGSVLSAATAGRLALTEAGVGPGVADGLIRLTQDELATRLLAAAPDRRT